MPPSSSEATPDRSELSCAESALAPATAMAGEAQPSFLDASKQNYDPSVQDWADAYKPVDKALNKMFETRITNDNARQEQYELAVVSDLSLSTEQGSAGPSLSFTDTSL